MKRKFHHKVALCSIAFVFCSRAYSDPLSLQERIDAALAEGSVARLSLLANECETFWPSNAILYFQSQNKVGEALEVLAKTNSTATKELENQTEEILGRSCPADGRSENACFKFKFQIAQRFARASVTAPDVQGTEVLARFLGEVRTTLNTNYHFTPMSMNVMPPVAPKGQGVFSGMDPNAISDPVARVAYLKAIDENAQIGEENDLQLHTLPEINGRMTPLFLNYLKALFARNPDAKSKWNSFAALAHLTKDEQQQ